MEETPNPQKQPETLTVSVKISINQDRKDFVNAARNEADKQARKVWDANFAINIGAIAKVVWDEYESEAKLSRGPLKSRSALTQNPKKLRAAHQYWPTQGQWATEVAGRLVDKEYPNISLIERSRRIKGILRTVRNHLQPLYEKIPFHKRPYVKQGQVLANYSPWNKTKTRPKT